MKNLIVILSVIVILISCSEKKESSWEAKYSPDGKDSVVNVNYVDNSGNQNNFFMNYLMFRMLFGNGGYQSVNNYYTTHKMEFSSPSSYSNYKPKPTYSSSSSSSPVRGYSSPSTSSSSRSLSSPSRSSGYSSPSRSSGYSSPSRSYSSPARSYSSPSRGYSSPSRGR